MPSSTYLLILLTSAVLLAALPPSAGDSPSVYEVLQSYDFPAGLLPVGVTGYELDPSTGKFSVYLDKSCSFTISGYDLKFKSEISGTISRGKIKDLQGIQVKVLFFWVNIVEVTRDGDELELSVGILSATFPVDNFYESPQCGCGFDCVNYDAGKRCGRKFSFTSVM